jgi:hypothetical protein
MVSTRWVVFYILYELFRGEFDEEKSEITKMIFFRKKQKLVKKI